MSEPAEEQLNEPVPAEETEDGQQAASDSEEAAAPTIEQQLTEERDRSAAYLEDLQRERASFINFRRRAEQEREQWSREAAAALIYNLLPVLDDFERAREAIPADQQGSPWVDGILLVGRKLYSTLELAGLRAIEADGKPFDPALHEAVSTAPAEDGESGAVLKELRKGYLLGERVLRPSMVIVAQ